ncbi:hypothetical protein CANCADRAFT_16776, partial [Tortispora caseinolytica NRRL Y-17796]
EVVPNGYIIRLKPNVELKDHFAHVPEAQQVKAASSEDHDEVIVSSSSGEQITVKQFSEFEFGTVKGYTGIFDEETIEMIKSSSDVEQVYPDQFVTASAPVAAGGRGQFYNWGLGRISHYSDDEADDSVYVADPNAGAGTTVFVIDGGIDVSHPQFEGRASIGYNGFDSSPTTSVHGTHVAGIVASKDYGVAPKAKVIGIRVIDDNGDGVMSNMIRGHAYIYENYKNCDKCVINFSVYCDGLSDALETIQDALVDAGFVYVGAAGNKAVSACDTTPGHNTKSVIVAGNLDQNGLRATGTNGSSYGPCVDIWAPGSVILSTIPNGKLGYMSGTSMASPHVAGVAATYL